MICYRISCLGVSKCIKSGRLMYIGSRTRHDHVFSCEVNIKAFLKLETGVKANLLRNVP